jgi:hypothetical protein
MTFDADERGVETSQPREFIEISHGTTTYRVACGQRDIYYNGALFAATAPAARGELRFDQVTSLVAMEIQLPANHAFVARYLAMSSPPRQITATVRRQQLQSGDVQTIWIGYVVSIAIDRHTAKISVPARTAQALTISVPTMLVDSSCTNVLYDAGCAAVRGSFTISATVSAVDGRSVTVSSMSGNPDQWAQFGELIHVSSGEQMMIIDQTGTAITMQAPIAEMRLGDSIQIAAGCDHSIDTCSLKFSNVVNYGGLPQRPTSDIYLPHGFGIREQT